MDSALETIATATQGLHPADEVRALLAAIREHALRSKETEGWAIGLNLDQPTHETIKETVTYLRDLT